MKTMDIIQRTREYLDYLEAHIKNNKKAWDVICKACPNESFVYDDFKYHTISRLIDEHDLSKLSEEEFVQYRRHFYPVENDFIPDEPGNAYDVAWLHHLKVNEHHWEHWTKRDFYQPHAAECHCICMLADWMAMGMYFDEPNYILNTLEYYEKNKETINLPKWAEELICEVLGKVSEANPDE